MRIADLNGKKVCILGFGKEAKAMFHAIEDYAPNAYLTMADKNPEPIHALIEANSPSNPTKMKTPWITRAGPDAWLRAIDTFDVIIKSPGIPTLPELVPYASKITTSTQIFFDSIQGSGAMTIGVTGSKGKSTTASLIAAILKEAGKNVHLVGNIGEPAIAHIADAKKGAIFVMEMSSYQLMDLRTSPHIAVVTSFFPEHLDYHGSEEAYLEAKKNIARFQNPHDVVFFSTNFFGSTEIAKEGEGRKIPFSEVDSPVELADIQLIGAHNLSNIAGAYEVALELGVKPEVAIQVIKNFKGLPHRLQSMGTKDGIEWIDDAISTTPESTIAALDALGDRVHTVILGGQDRGYDFSALAERIKKSSVKTIILFPGSGSRIRDALIQNNVTARLLNADSMEKAVTIAKEETKDGIVLLSTASPSYGMFKNFEEKGEIFKKCIGL